MDQCSRQRSAGTTPHQPFVFRPQAGARSDPRTQHRSRRGECSPARGYQAPSLPAADSVAPIRPGTCSAKVTLGQSGVGQKVRDPGRRHRHGVQTHRSRPNPLARCQRTPPRRPRPRRCPLRTRQNSSNAPRHTRSPRSAPQPNQDLSSTGLDNCSGSLVAVRLQWTGSVRPGVGSAVWDHGGR